VQVTATVNGLDSSWDGSQDNYTYVCAPATCTGSACGTMQDGCGGTLSCGCPPGQVCNGGGACCTPDAFACTGQTCGTASDGCGGWVTCGPACPCLTPAQACQGLQCGFASDGCGGQVSCGSCPNGEACGGGICVTKSCPKGLINCPGLGCTKPSNCF
jgi:hypothetical protein